MFLLILCVGVVQSWRPLYRKLGVFDANTYESSLMFWPPSDSLIVMESIGCQYYDHAENWDQQYRDHSYFRIRDLASGDVITNISTSIGFGFGAAFVEKKPTGKDTMWVFGVPYDRCKNPVMNSTEGVYAWRSTDLVNWERGRTDVNWTGTNVDVANVRGPTPGLPSHNFIMVTHLGYFFYFPGSELDFTGWRALDHTRYNTNDIPEMEALPCPSIRYFAPYYYVIGGGLRVVLIRSKDLKNWEEQPDTIRTFPLIERSADDGKIAPYANFVNNAERSNSIEMLEHLDQWDKFSNDADMCCDFDDPARNESWLIFGVSSQGQAPAWKNLTGPTSFQGLGRAEVPLKALLESYFV